MSNPTILSIITSIGVGIFILYNIPWDTFQNVNHEEIIEDFEYAGEKICGINDAFFNSIAQNYQNSEIEEIRTLEDSILKKEATKCEIGAFVELISYEDRKKINKLEFVCNVRECAQNVIDELPVCQAGQMFTNAIDQHMLGNVDGWSEIILMKLRDEQPVTFCEMKFLDEKLNMMQKSQLNFKNKSCNISLCVD